MIEEEKLKLMLFMVVRNSKVLPIGMKLNKTEKEITDMTKETIKELEREIKLARKEKAAYKIEIEEIKQNS